MKIDPKHAADLYELLDYDHDRINPNPPIDDTTTLHGWTLLGSAPSRTSRWHERYWMVLRNADDETWGVNYGIGLTEYQENDLPWEDTTAPLALTRLYPHEVTRVEYHTKPAADVEAGAE